MNKLFDSRDSPTNSNSSTNWDRGTLFSPEDCLEMVFHHNELGNDDRVTKLTFILVFTKVHIHIILDRDP